MINSEYAKIFSNLSLQKINLLEFSLLKLLDFTMAITSEEFQRMNKTIQDLLHAATTQMMKVLPGMVAEGEGGRPVEGRGGGEDGREGEGDHVGDDGNEQEEHGEGNGEERSPVPLPLSSSSPSPPSSSSPYLVSRPAQPIDRRYNASDDIMALPSSSPSSPRATPPSLPSGRKIEPQHQPSQDFLKIGTKSLSRSLGESSSFQQDSSSSQKNLFVSSSTPLLAPPVEEEGEGELNHHQDPSAAAAEKVLEGKESLSPDDPHLTRDDDGEPSRQQRRQWQRLSFQIAFENAVSVLAKYFRVSGRQLQRQQPQQQQWRRPSAKVYVIDK
jgi:hypothetical protein